MNGAFFSLAPGTLMFSDHPLLPNSQLHFFPHLPSLDVSL